MMELIRFAAESFWNLCVVLSILWSVGITIIGAAAVISDFRPILVSINRKKEVKNERDPKV